MQCDIRIVIRNASNLNASNLTDPGTKICHASCEDNGDGEHLHSLVKGFAAMDNLALVKVEG